MNSPAMGPALAVGPPPSGDLLEAGEFGAPQSIVDDLRFVSALPCGRLFGNCDAVRGAIGAATAKALPPRVPQQ